MKKDSILTILSGIFDTMRSFVDLSWIDNHDHHWPN